MRIGGRSSCSVAGARRGARPLAVGAVAAVICGLGASPSTPTCSRPTSRSTQAAAPSATLTSLLIVFGAAVVLVLPSMALLYTLAQRGLVEEDEAPSATAASDAT